MISSTQKRLACLIAMIGFGAVAQLVQSDRTPLYGTGATEDVFRRGEVQLLNDPTLEPSAPILRPENGFNPFEESDPPPAELLALGDWPLDSDGSAGGVAASETGFGAVPAPQEIASYEASHLAQDAVERLDGSARNDVVEGTADAAGPDGKGKLERFDRVTVNPVAAMLFPKLIEKETGATAVAKSIDGVMDALVAAFEASDGVKRPSAVEGPSAVQRAEEVNPQSGGNALSAKEAARRDKTQDSLRATEMHEVAEGGAVATGIKQLVSKSRDLLGELIASIGFDNPEKKEAEVAKATKPAGPADEDIPAIPNDARERALASTPGKSGVFGKEQIVVAATSLDEMRGGFIDSSGLQLSFGIDRATYINGVLVAQTSLSYDGLAAATGRGLSSADVADATGVKLIKTLPGNGVEITNLSSTGIGQVIQNNLNNQDIRSVSTVNASVNSVQILRSIRFSEAILSGLTGR